MEKNVLQVQRGRGAWFLPNSTFVALVKREQAISALGCARGVDAW